jgi:hypothetical protein
MGVSLNPILRDAFFDRTKKVWEIGPFYTASLVPGLDALYRMTGRQPPAPEPDRFALPPLR